MDTGKQIFDLLEKLCGTPVSDERLLLREDLGLDSLNLVVLLLDLEKVFAIELAESDVDPGALLTVGDVIALAERYGSHDE